MNAATRVARLAAALRSRDAWRTLARHPAWAWVAIVGVSLLALASFASIGEDVFTHESGTLDGAVRAWVQAHRNQTAFHLFEVLTWLGSSYILCPLAAGVGIWLWRKRGHEMAASVVIAPSLAVSLYNSIKLIVARPRPAGLFGIHANSFSFPSGHAAMSVAAVIPIAFVLRRERILPRSIAVAVALAVPLVAGVSRVYLDVHWATDVLGGWSIGLLVAMLGVGIYHRVSVVAGRAM
jgi:membrane-associated phospholipid phosphatase